MCCFTCFGASNGLKNSWKCWKGKSTKEDETTRKGKQRGFICCLCGERKQDGGRTKDEGRPPKDEESSKDKGGMCLFNCNKSTKDIKDKEPTRERLKCGMDCFICGMSSKDKKPLRWKGKDVCEESSKDEKPSRMCGKCGKDYCNCDKSSKDEKLSGKKGESGKGRFICGVSTEDCKDEEPTRKRLKCGMGCFICGISSEDKESFRTKGKGVCDESSENEKPSRKCGKSGKGYFSCNKYSKDEGLSGKKKESGKGCFICCVSTEDGKDEEPARERLKCGMGWFICGTSSEDKKTFRRKGKGVCDESSEDEKPSRKCGKCGKGYCNCDKSSKDEELSGKRGESRMDCFDCDTSSKYEGLLGNKGKCGMGCFTHPKSPNDEESSRTKGTCGMDCFCCNGSRNGENISQKGGKCGNCFNGNKRSSEDPSRKKDEGFMSCFCGFKPSKKEEGPGEVGDKDTRGPDGQSSKRKCGRGYCNCVKSSKDEEMSGKRGESGMGCFDCDESSKYEELPGKKGKCGMGCFTCGKSTKDQESSRKKGKCGMTCFCCSGSRNEENLSQKGGKCGNCFNGNKRSSEDPSRKKDEGCMSCFCSFKPSKKEEALEKVGDKVHCRNWRNKKSNKPGRKMLWRKRKEKREINQLASLVKTISFNSESGKKRSQVEEILRIGNGNITAREFTYNDLSEATQNFAPQCLLGMGGFGKVYKGQFKSTNQTIAVKKLDRNGYQGNREFIVEVLMLSILRHQNLVNMIGYCADGNERILVYDYMSHGSLEDHLFDLSPNRRPLDWKTRMKIAAGAARGLEHLHDTANPPVIYRDLKSSNILLDEDYNPRLADFGLAKLGPVGDKNHVSTRVMGTYGYCAPEYALTGQLTTMSDIYSFGVVLLELITGRKAMDLTRPRNEQKLVDWVKPHFQDRKNFVQLADPLLEGKFPVKALYQALAVSTLCLQEEETTRPPIKDVLFALQFLAMPEKSTVPNKLPTEPPREINSTSTDDWQSCSDQEQEEQKLISQLADVR